MNSRTVPFFNLKKKVFLVLVVFQVVLGVVVCTTTVAAYTDWSIYTPLNSGLPNNPWSIAIDEKGNAWIGTFNGLVKFDGTNWTIYHVSNPRFPYGCFLCDWVSSIVIDSDGSIWSAVVYLEGGSYSSTALAKFDGLNWTIFDPYNSGLPGSVSSIGIDASGNKWIGTHGYGLAKFDNTNWVIYNTSNSGLHTNYLTSGLAIDSAGNLWIGTQYGVAKFDGVTYWERYDPPQNLGFYPGSVTSIAIDQNDDKWVGCAAGLAKFDGNAWTVYDSTNVLPGDWVTSIAIDANDNKWIGITPSNNIWHGNTGGGLVKFDGSTWTVFTQANSGLPDDSVLAVTAAKNNEIWVGTNIALAIYKQVTPTNNPPNPPTYLKQLKSDYLTVISVGGTTDERTVVFKGTVSDPDGDKVRLQVELRNLNEFGGQFDETKGDFIESTLVDNGSEVVVSRGELIDEGYHWRARTVDEHGEKSDWVEFGENDISEADFTVAGVTYTYDPQAAVNYAETWWNTRNSIDADACDPYKDYGDYDCANFVSQCLIAGGLDLSVHPDADPCKCIPSCTKLRDYLVNYLGITWDTRLKGDEEPEWFNPGDPAIFGYTDDYGTIHSYAHAVIAVTRDGTVRCDAHSVNRHNKTIQDFYNISALYDDNPFDRCTFYHILSPAKPVLTSPLEITPEKDTYCVGDTLTAEFTITNLGGVPITLDKLLVGGRFNGDKLPDGKFPDFTFQSVTLQPNVPNQYTGTLELTHSGNYQFFIAYYIENPTPEEKALLDENNWNTCIDLGEGLTDEDRTEEIYTAPGYAIIVAGQADWRQKSAIDHSANNAYRALRNLGFDDDHIFYLNSNQPQDIDGDGDSEVDALALLSPFETAINQVKAEIGDNPTPLVFYLTGHGLNDPDCFIFDEGNPSEGYLWVAKFQEELDKFSEETPMLIVLGSCYSGRFITSNEGISAPNRIIITAAHDDEERKSALGLGGWYHSSDRFWGNLNKGLNVKDAFITDLWPGDRKHLWLDDNGDRIGHPPQNLGNDGALASVTTIGVAGSENLELTSWYSVWIHSAGELRVYDSKDRVTGLVTGEVKEEIPNSTYDEENEIVAIFSPADTYRHEIVGVDEGTYGLDIASIKKGEAITFTATDIPTSLNATHRYLINWTTLSQGGAGVTLRIDADGDGEFEETITIQPPLANFTYTPENPVINQTITFDASNSIDLDGNITSYKWDFGDGANGTGEIILHSYSSAGNYSVALTVRDYDGATTSTSKTISVHSPFFDTGPGNYPSIMGNHTGTITPICNINVSRLYTYPCAGTGGHTEYAAICYPNGTLLAEAHWEGYVGDWHNITFNETFVLYKGETYNYTIITGSYPQIHHTPSLLTANGWINCTEFVDANGKVYTDWIPVIRLY